MAKTERFQCGCQAQVSTPAEIVDTVRLLSTCQVNVADKNLEKRVANECRHLQRISDQNQYAMSHDGIR